MFEDDFSPATHAKSVGELAQKIENITIVFDTWFHLSNLKLNVGKTKENW